MSEISLKEYLKKNHQLNADNPIDYRLLEEIPFFEEVFSDDRELWEIIARISGNTGIAHIEDKKYRPGEKIVHEESLDQMVFWVVSGLAEAVREEFGKRRVVRQFKKGDCFGELTIIKAQPRTADVVAGKEGVRVLEVDWALADRCFELKALFTELLLKTIANKLEDSFGVPVRIIDEAAKSFKKRDQKIRELEEEITRLKNF